MADVNIEVGLIANYGFVGVQPPLSEIQMEALRNAEWSDATVRSEFATHVPEAGDPFSVFMKPKEGNKAEKHLVGELGVIAASIKRVLTRDGTTVSIDRKVHRLGDDGIHLFGASVLEKATDASN